MIGDWAGDYGSTAGHYRPPLDPELREIMWSMLAGTCDLATRERLAKMRRSKKREHYGFYLDEPRVTRWTLTRNGAAKRG